MLNLLAFFIHQILELCDPHYQHCRGCFSLRHEYWNNLRVAIRFMFFDDFKHLVRVVGHLPETRLRET